MNFLYQVNSKKFISHFNFFVAFMEDQNFDGVELGKLQRKNEILKFLKICLKVKKISYNY